MNITLKRILIIFSIMLNIGFVITAAIVIYYHPANHRERHLTYSENAVKSLHLLPDKEKRMLAAVKDFHQKMSETKKDFKEYRAKILSVLAEPGPIDQDRFEASVNGIHERHGQLHEMIRGYVLKMRQDLGDENGARFFHELKRQLQSEKVMR